MSQRWASLCYNLGVETKLLRHKRRKNVILYFRKSEILLFISHSLKTERPKLHTLAFYMSQHLFIHRGLYTRIAFWWISTPQRSPRQFIFFITIFFLGFQIRTWTDGVLHRHLQEISLAEFSTQNTSNLQ